ncbi:hypothetical protein [Massilia rubra]|uniref:hypothetical protein n=1 Tax=Massilia rubra TaxID=2607910 RepID=UPI001E5FF852|nr:hypothetical protein [Massilia rubra]
MAAKLGVQTNLPDPSLNGEKKQSNRSTRVGESKNANIAGTANTQTKRRSPEARDAALHALRENKDLFTAEAVISRSERLLKKS